MFLKLCQYVKDLLNIWYVPDQYKTQEMCNEVVEKSPYALSYVPDHFVTQEMCNEAVEKSPWMLEHVPNQFVTQKMCNEAVEKNPQMLELVPDQFVTQKMCNEAVEKIPCALRWYKGYEQREAQKAKIKEELMPVAWHPDRWWNQCVPEHEKKELEFYFA